MDGTDQVGELQAKILDSIQFNHSYQTRKSRLLTQDQKEKGNNEMKHVTTP